MVTVNVRNYGGLDKALKVFKTKVRRAQILEISQRKAFYISPSEMKHRRRFRKSK